MKHSGRCPKCGSERIVRIPDNGRYANGNNIYLKSTIAFAGRIPVIRYVCCECGYVEEWVEDKEDMRRLEERFGKGIQRN